MSKQFELVSMFAPAGDQPAAIAGLVEGLQAGEGAETVYAAFDDSGRLRGVAINPPSSHRYGIDNPRHSICFSEPHPTVDP